MLLLAGMIAPGAIPAAAVASGATVVDAFDEVTADQRRAQVARLNLGQGTGEEPAAADLGAAMAAAGQLNEAVEILDMTTENARYLANPDASISFEVYATPQRVRKLAGWVPADPTLEFRYGRVAPRAGLLGVTLSAGGSGELVTLSQGRGALGLSWMRAVPRPRISGQTATYPEVLPGVDLLVRVDVDSVSTVLKVKTRQASANPELARLGWRVRAENLSLEVGGDGAVRAVDAGGGVVFAAPPSMMWDSPGLDESLPALMGEPVIDEPQPGRVEPMRVAVADDVLVVQPDLGMLADPSTVFPVFIDPSFGFNLTNWAPVHKSRPNTSWPSGTSNPRDVIRVGYNNWSGCGSNCGVWRSHIRFSISGISGKNYRLVSSPKFAITLLHSASCGDTPVALWRTNSIGSGGVTWNSMKDKWLTGFGTRSVSANGSSCGQPDVDVSWSNSTMKSKLQSAMNNGYGTFTVGLRASNEGDRNQWKKFSRTGAFLSGTFNSVPKVPTSVKPQGDCVGSCTSPATVRVTRPYVQAKVNNPLGGKVTAEFQLRDHATGSVVATASRTVSNGAVATWRVPSLSNGKVYRFRVRARNSDGIAGSYSSYFRFTVDTSGPTKPTSVGVYSTGSCYQSCSSPAMLRDRRPTFKATTKHPFGDNLSVRFEVRDSASGTLVSSGTVSPVSAGTAPTWRPGSSLPQETTMRLRVRSTDQYSRNSSWSSYFTFTVDTNSPSSPTVTSSLYAPKSTGTWNGGVGVAGSFTFGPNGSGDVVRYEWRFNGGAVSGDDVSKGSSTTVSLAPPSDLEQQLQVRTIDHAGNVSSWRDYLFYVRPQPADAGYWKFDEGAGATAASSISEGLTGTLRGGAGWASSGINPADPGASGSAVSLNGTDAYVEMPPAVATNHAAGFTVSAWVKPTELAAYRTAVSQIGDNVYAFRLYYSNGSDRWCFSMKEGDSTGADATYVCSSVTPQAEVWTHLVGVYDKPAGKLRLYVNGGPFNGQPVPGTVDEADAPVMWAATGSFRVGRARNGEYWLGLVDEVRAHQRVLDASEVSQIFQSCLQASCPPVPEPDAVTLIGAWDLDEASGPTASDSSGLGNDGTLQGGSRRTAFGYDDSRAVWFDGESATVATDGHALLTDRSFTVSAWVSIAELGRWQTVVAQDGQYISAFRLEYGKSSDTWCFRMRHTDEPAAQSSAACASTPQVGRWTHLVGVYDATALQLRLYVDGQWVATQANSLSAWQADGPLTIGRTLYTRTDGTVANDWFHGTIDLVRAYQGAMSDAMVAQLYGDQLALPAPPPVLAGDWRMDDQAGSFVFDHTWMGNDGLLSGGAAWPAAGEAYASEYGVVLDGVSGKVTTGWVPVLTSESFSISAWVRLASGGEDHTAVSLDGQTSGAMRVYYDATLDRFCVQMSHQDSIGPDVTTACADQALTVGVWAHVVAVFEKPQRSVTLYVDGQPVAAATYGGLEPWQAGGPVVIGRALIDGTEQQWWHGGVARVEAHHGAMSAGQVADLFADQRDTTPLPVIDAPDASLEWTAGQLISFSGHATSLGEQLPAAELSWRLRSRDCVDRDDPDCSVEILQSWAGVGAGTFTTPTSPEPVFLELELTASGESGTATTWIELAPAVVTLTFTTEPTGLEVTAGGVTAGSPYETAAVVGAALTISAADQQDESGRTFAFAGWSHGGDQTQDILVPSSGGSYHAQFTIVNEAPVAEFAAACDGQVCAFDGSPSVDPDGEIVWYEWDFGDGATTEGGPELAASPTHTYADVGDYAVTLVVTDDQGETASGTGTVSALTPARIYPVGSAVDSDRLDATTHTVQIPAGVRSGDLMVMVWTANADAAQTGATAPGGWDLSNVAEADGASGAVYSRTATSLDAGSQVTITTAVPVRGTLILTTYRHAASVVTYPAVDTTLQAEHTTPGVESEVSAGAWVVSYWADVSDATTSWAAPAGLAVRQTGAESGARHLSWLLADSDGPADGAQQTAVADSPAAETLMFSIVLRPASVDPDNAPPTASFFGYCALTWCDLNGADSADPDGQIEWYEWDFGDGGQLAGPQHTVSHTYPEVWVCYQARLTVVDDQGAAASSTSIVCTEGL